MEEKILRMCRRLKQFSQAEIELISDIPQQELQNILNNLIEKNKILFCDGIYYLKKTNNFSIKEKPLFYMFHSKAETDFFIKGFCADVETKKMVYLFNEARQVFDKYYNYFRKLIYEKQKNNLIKNFENEPKIGQERKYMDTKVYLYLYDNQLYVSEILLKSIGAKKHTNQERLKIKNIYLRSYRKVLNRAFAFHFYWHLSEAIWRQDKNFNDLYMELKALIS